MKVNKKVTDFIVLEKGNIGRKAAVVTGALLTSSVLGSVLTMQTAKAGDHCDNHANGHTAVYYHRDAWYHNENWHDDGHYDDPCAG